MTTTALVNGDAMAATAPRWLPSVASGITEFVWPLYLTLVFTLGAWVLVPTLFLGWGSATIISGSMRPTVQPGSVVVYEPYRGQDVGLGTVVTFHDAHVDRLVTHRVARVDDDGTMHTKGDANAQEDLVPLTRDRIVGVGRIVVPVAGLPALWVYQGRLGLLAAFAALTVLAAGPASRSAAGCARAVRRSVRRRGGRHLRRRSRAPALTAGALLVVIGFAGMTIAHGAFAGADANPGNSFQAGSVGTASGLTATAGCQLLVLGPKVDLAWTGAAGANGYTVLRSTSATTGFATVGTSTGTSWTDTGVGLSTTYYYRVRPTAGAWTGADTATVSVKTKTLCL